MREAKAPRKYDKRLLALAERLVSELSPAERRTVAVLALADRLIEWMDTEADAAHARIKASGYFPVPEQG